MTKAPKYDRKRGQHKKRVSIETREWERAHLAPAPPVWMPPETARDLLALRRRLDVLT